MKGRLATDHRNPNILHLLLDGLLQAYWLILDIQPDKQSEKSRAASDDWWAPVGVFYGGWI